MPYIDLYALEAIKLIIGGYKEIVSRGEERRKKVVNLHNFLISNNYAGISFVKASECVVHTMSCPIVLNIMFH